MISRWLTSSSSCWKFRHELTGAVRDAKAIKVSSFILFTLINMLLYEIEDIFQSSRFSWLLYFYNHVAEKASAKAKPKEKGYRELPSRINKN
jgi:hypothetical protein